MKQSNLVKIFKALSNDQRLNLFRNIYYGFEQPVKKKAKKPVCCDWIGKAFTSACDCMNLSRSTISHHFKELQNAGLITCERVGQSFQCKINEEAIKEIQGFLK